MFLKFLSVFAVFFVAFFSMAMGSKRPDAKPSVRQLKMSIEVGKIEARSFNVPGGASFDFQSALNAQLLDVLQSTNRFIFKKPTVLAAQVPSCTLDTPQLHVDGNANSFEFLGSGGIRFGYTPDGRLDGVSGNISINVSQAQLDLSLWGIDPLAHFLRVSTNVGSRETNTKIGASINFKDFELGPEYFFRTPLAKVTKKGIEKAVSNIIAQAEKISWEAHVIQNNDTHVIINAGRNSGIKRGDKFKIYNVTHYWKGEPCNSDYLGSTSTDKPVALVVVDKEPGDDLSEAFVYMQDPDRNVAVGAKVHIEALEP